MVGLTLLLAFLLTPTLAEEVKVLLEVPAPFTTDVRWFPDGRHLLLANCAGEFSEEEEGNLPYGVCRFLVFDTQTKRSIPVKRASGRGNWQDPNLLHLAVANGSNCLWAVSPGGELFVRALPEGVAPDGLRMDSRGLWVVTTSAQGFYLYRYDPQSDRYYEAGSYDYGEDPLDAFLIIKIDDDLREGFGRRGGSFLIPFSNPYSPELDLALVWDADYVPFGSFIDSPVYEEVSLIRTSDRRGSTASAETAYSFPLVGTPAPATGALPCWSPRRTRRGCSTLTSGGFSFWRWTLPARRPAPCAPVRRRR